MKLGRRSSASSCMLIIVAAVAVLASTHAAAQSSTSPAPNAICINECGGSPPGFFVRAFNGTMVRNGGKCLDYGDPQVAGSPVFLNDCAAAHPIVVTEVNVQHDVILHAGTLVIGIRHHAVFSQGGPSGPPSASEIPLELQHQVSGLTPLSANQIFSLDGDSIILASSRPASVATDFSRCFYLVSGRVCGPVLVAKVQNARGANGTPIVVGPRDLAEAEFWDFQSTDGVDRDPTSGFVRVTTLDQLLHLIPPSEATADGEFVFCPSYAPDPAVGPGTVIKIAPDASIDLTNCKPLQIPPGVTIRGDRSGTVLFANIPNAEGLPPETFFPDGTTMLEIQGNDVRITGLRLQGTSSNTAKHQFDSKGVLAHDDLFVRGIVDHNDISHWTDNGVIVKGADPETYDLPFVCNPHELSDPETRPTNTFVARNFIHHNRMQDYGYGVESNWGAYPFIEGNTFVSNRHAIAAGVGSPHTAYRAWFNLVLSDAPLQTGAGIFDFHEQDFDMHGTDRDHDHFGGVGGDYMDIFRNTFFGTNRPNFKLRGVPCNYAEFHNNVSLESESDAVTIKLSDDPLQAVAIPNGDDPLRISAQPNQFNFSNPTTSLGVGDFDGDGRDDLFMATGTAWYYASAGSAAWRFLSAKTDAIDGLRFGDFDGDGRTDVVAIHGGNLVISWGGVSEWEVLYAAPAPITDLAVGDFDGDGKADIFWADGQTWYIAYGGGNGQFVPVQTSSFHVKDLRFGDFDGDGTTDVFGVVNGNWMISKGTRGVQGTLGGWSLLRPRLTDTVGSLVVADFDGDGRADVAIFGPVVEVSPPYDGELWLISYGGVGDWTSHSGLAGSELAGVGRFSGNPGADVLLWCHGSPCNDLYIASGGTGAAQLYSPQDMK